MYIYTYIHIYIYTYIHIYISTYIGLYTYMCPSISLWFITGLHLVPVEAELPQLGLDGFQQATTQELHVMQHIQVLRAEKKSVVRLEDFYGLFYVYIYI